MFIIRQHKSSICPKELLIVLLEFTVVDKCTSNHKNCENSNTRDISYFTVGNESLVWNEAWKLCNNYYNSTLPVICNQHEQDALTLFLRESLGSSAMDVWTAGKRTSFNEWRWIDGQLFNNRSVIAVQHDTYSCVALKEARNYRAQNPNDRVYYLCQYSDSLCNSENDIRLTNGCVRPSDDDRAWYDARNQCLKNGGDLAVLTDADLNILRESNKLKSARSYWIGLRRNAWYWTRQITVPSAFADEEITFTNWSAVSNSLTDNCISIDARNGSWVPDKCNNLRKVICQTSSYTTSSRPTSEDATLSAANVDTQILLVAVLIGGLCVIVILVISIVIAVLVVRKYYVRRANASSNSAETETTSYQDLKTIRRQANPDGAYTELQLQPVYDEVAQRDRREEEAGDSE